MHGNQQEQREIQTQHCVLEQVQEKYNHKSYTDVDHQPAQEEYVLSMKQNGEMQEMYLINRVHKEPVAKQEYVVLPIVQDVQVTQTVQTLKNVSIINA